MRIAIAGAGAAGLSLALHLTRATIPDLQISLTDRSFEPASDKTWCFWDEDSVILPGMVRKEWTVLNINGPMGTFTQPIRQHTYRMVDSGTFKRLASSELGDTVERIEAPITQTDPNADLVFQSVTPPSLIEPYLKQHFLGWEVVMEKPVFDPDVATIMDFKVDQSHGFAFMYLLPISATEALVEYTLFTDVVLEKELYRDEIKRYLSVTFPGAEYTMMREEFGVIPMVPGAWTPGEGRVQNIGGAAGLAKPSTGYTFARIQRDSSQIAASLQVGKLHRLSPSDRRKEWMDEMIIRIIREDPSHAVHVFEHLFRTNGMDLMLRFLDEKTSLAEDLRIMSSVPSWWEFVKRVRI